MRISYPPSLEVLISQRQLERRVEEMARQIALDYKKKEPTFISILKGSFVFTADLIRKIDIPCRVDFMTIASYGDKKESSGVVRLLQDLSHSIEGEDVIIVEDIVDTGLTLGYIRENLLTRHPASLKVAVLLHKNARTKVAIPLDYVGFVIPNRFVVGYGLDEGERWRNLPYIAVVETH